LRLCLAQLLLIKNNLSKKLVKTSSTYCLLLVYSEKHIN
jgi:hypothetical protein